MLKSLWCCRAGSIVRGCWVLFWGFKAAEAHHKGRCGLCLCLCRALTVHSAAVCACSGSSRPRGCDS